jgi:Flp pilus assembly protein CpaB
MRRGIYLSAFVLFSVLAALIYYNQTRLSTAVVAIHELSAGTRIQDSDVTGRPVTGASLPDTVLRSPQQAIGQIVSSRILEGQFVDMRQLGPLSRGGLLTAGLQVPSGFRIIGLPITPATAVGGALKPGDAVDVMAIPNPSKSVLQVDNQVAPPVTLGRNILVIGLRTDQGGSVGSSDHSLNVASGDKATSVLLAIPPGDEASYSAAIANATFVLALSTD